MKSFHTPRRCKGRNEVLNAMVAKLDGVGEVAEFLMFSWLTLGGTESNCPVKYPAEAWNRLYQDYPELHPAQQYHGEW
jgi:hypothetical protein